MPFDRHGTERVKNSVKSVKHTAHSACVASLDQTLWWFSGQFVQPGQHKLGYVVPIISVKFNTLFKPCMQ